MDEEVKVEATEAVEEAVAEEAEAGTESETPEA